jgi:hypothetical protein
LSPMLFYRLCRPMGPTFPFHQKRLRVPATTTKDADGAIQSRERPVALALHLSNRHAIIGYGRDAPDMTCRAATRFRLLPLAAAGRPRKNEGHGLPVADSTAPGHPAIECNSAKIFLQLHFLEEKVGYKATQTQILSLQAPDLIRLFAILWRERRLGISCGRRRWAHHSSAGLAPAVIRHQAHTQRLGNVSVEPALCRHFVRHGQLCLDL